ncbi:methylmalonyl Co-A mutase-associated GTPase MeaB [candidate division WOR-3 bacterium]|nr:methylmalonyl Co-A mutase-associated GTPase MeaB [candidate division WOR-3 bacterium]
MNLLKKLLKGNKLAIARVISEVENDSDAKILEKISPYTGKAYHIGITGPPGAGKSTLVNTIAKKLLEKNNKIGIIAVDPTSPFSGGALLGDRIRMTDLALQKNVFIRSIASRGSLGGLASKTKDAALVLDASGMDYILIETIGVGQVELDIAQVCDTTVVVLVPESGDSIQAMKAGLLEIADITVVNKGDREGCDTLIMELKFAFELREQKAGWHFPILKTIATENKGIEELVSAIASHRAYLHKSGKLEDERKAKLMLRIHELIEEKIRTHLKEKIIKENELKAMVEKVYKRKLNPYRIAGKIAKGIIKSQTKWK